MLLQSHGSLAETPLRSLLEAAQGERSTGTLTLRNGNGESTALPSSLAETASWDPEIARQFGTVIGKETRDQGFNVSLGGGIDLALACDWRIAVEGAKLRFIHNELGFTPPWGAIARLVALVRPQIVLRLFATCELVSAQEARVIGVVDDVVAPHKLMSRAESLAVRIGRADRHAVKETKRLLRPGVPYEEHARAFAALWDARPATIER